MFSLIKKVFYVLLNFRESLETKCVLFKERTYMTRPTLVDLNPVEGNYYPSMISLDKFKVCCNFFDDLSTKICIPSKTKNVNVIVFNLIT